MTNKFNEALQHLGHVYEPRPSLRELETALLALPEKRLIADALEMHGDVCAIGALAKLKHYSGSMELPKTFDEFDEHKIQDAMLNVAKELGVPRMVAIAVIAENDADGYHRNATPEWRYEHVLRWTREHMNTKETDSQ